MTKYSPEYRLRVVLHFLDNRRSGHSTSKVFGVSRNQVARWVGLYRHHGEAGLRPSFTHYTTAFKTRVLAKMKAESLSSRAVSALYGISSPSTVDTWVKRYAQLGVSGLQRRQQRRMGKTPKPPTSSGKPSQSLTDQELRDELDYLRAENAYLKKLEALAHQKRLAAKKKH